MNYDREEYHHLLTDIAKLCAIKLKTLKAYTNIVIAHEKRLSDDSSQYLTQIEAALVKTNRAIKAMQETINHIKEAEESFNKNKEAK